MQKLFWIQSWNCASRYVGFSAEPVDLSVRTWITRGLSSNIASTAYWPVVQLCPPGSCHFFISFVLVSVHIGNLSATLTSEKQNELGWCACLFGWSGNRQSTIFNLHSSFRTRSCLSHLSHRVGMSVSDRTEVELRQQYPALSMALDLCACVCLGPAAPVATDRRDYFHRNTGGGCVSCN